MEIYKKYLNDEKIDESKYFNGEEIPNQVWIKVNRTTDKALLSFWNTVRKEFKSKDVHLRLDDLSEFESVAKKLILEWVYVNTDLIAIGQE